MSAETPAILFADLGLPESLLAALREVGYETPSPIQAATIPPLLAGRDVLGQAQTGTGKTAAFALPALARLEPAPGGAAGGAGGLPGRSPGRTSLRGGGAGGGGHVECGGLPYAIARGQHRALFAY